MKCFRSNWPAKCRTCHLFQECLDVADCGVFQSINLLALPPTFDWDSVSQLSSTALKLCTPVKPGGGLLRDHASSTILERAKPQLVSIQTGEEDMILAVDSKAIAFVTMRQNRQESLGTAAANNF